MSYTIDIYRRKIAPSESALEFALYVSFFAQLVAGPIVRSMEFLPQVRPMKDLRVERIAEGAQRFLLGLVKKVVIADNVGLFVDQVFAAPEGYGALTLWFASYGFALQIYCDFSGYTDMALGIGRAFGLRFPENFDAPYLAASITEFWRRWHMSLSRWLRDYLYFSLGGSRSSRAKTYRNLMITMLLGGLWHGAAWTFVLWGGLHGLMLAIERMLGFGRERDGPRGSPLAIGIRRFVTFQLTCVAWVMFRAESFESLGVYLSRMFGAWTWDGLGEIPGMFWTLVLVSLVAGQYLERIYRLRESVWERLPAPVQGLVLAAMVVLCGVYHVDEIAFIYFQF
jgi:D-alanyl-lipoteichoic acid acyltransferase DltB (MBOAT superfamily)